MKRNYGKDRNKFRIIHDKLCFRKEKWLAVIMSKGEMPKEGRGKISKGKMSKK